MPTHTRTAQTYEYEFFSLMGAARLANAEILGPGGRGVFNFSFFELGDAITRGMMFEDPTRFEFFLESASTLLWLYACVDLSHPPRFSLKADVIERFRDFSLSSKIGHIGQGFAVLASDRVLRYPVCLPFNSYFGGNSGPDYLLCFKDGGAGFGLLEAKGTLDSRRVKGKLKEAICQVKDVHVRGVQILEKYGFVSEISMNHARPVKCHFCDPDPGVVVSKKLVMKLLRKYYAAWSALFGDQELVKEILNNKGTSRTELSEAVGLRGNSIWDVVRASGIFPHRVRAEIDSKILNAVLREDFESYNKALREVRKRAASEFQGDQGSIVESLRLDGTKIFFESEKKEGP